MIVRFVPTLLVVNAGLAVVLGAMWLGPQGVLRHTAWQAPVPQAPNLDDAAKAALALNPALTRPYPEVSERPLFSPERRPGVVSNPEDVASAPPPPIALDKVVLTGIVSGPRLTGVLAQVDGESRFLKKGDKVGDWSLDDIKGRDVSFTQQGGQTRTLSLQPSFIEGGAAVPANATAAANRPSAMAAQQPVNPRRGAPGQAANRPVPVPPIGAVPAPVDAQAANPSSGGVSFGGGRTVRQTPVAKPTGSAK